MDAIGCESQFLSHLAPVWRALPERGTFHVEASLLDLARSLGVDAEPIEAEAIRRSMRAPRAAYSPDGPSALVASYGDIKVARRMGYRRFAFLEHGCGQAYTDSRHRMAHGSYAGGVDRDDCDLFLVPNEYSAARWRAAYPAAEVAVIGSTRVRHLPPRMPGPGPVVAISFHWPAQVHPYAGTAFGDFHATLKPLAERFAVIGHAHPKGDWPRRMERAYQRAGIEFVSDFDEVCRRADVYVADNTSTLYEFAATGRSVVVLNARHWNRDTDLGLRFWEAADVGPNVDPVLQHGRLDLPATTDRLAGAIERALVDGPEVASARWQALDIVFARLDGDVAAAEALMTWQTASQPVAA